MKEFLSFLAFLRKNNNNTDIADLHLIFDCMKKYTCSDFTDEEICCLFNNSDFERVFNENEIYS